MIRMAIYYVATAETRCHIYVRNLSITALLISTEQSLLHGLLELGIVTGADLGNFFRGIRFTPTFD